MKNLARMKWVLFSVAVGVGAGGGIMAGCASDDTIVHPPPDGSTDATIDTGNDTGTNDTGTDTGNDGGTDGTADVQDSGYIDSQSNFDVGAPNILTWVEQVTRLYCLKAQQCCDAQNGAGYEFNVDSCVTAYMQPPSRGAVTNLMIQPFLDGGKIGINSTFAQQCYDDINALSCGQTSATLNKMFADCINGAQGTIQPGQSGCASSAECIPQNHCDMPSDGGTVGTCASLRPANAACDVGRFQYDGGRRDFSFIYEPQAECGFLTSGKPYYCNNPDAYDGYHNRDAGISQCKPQLGAGSPCYNDFECASNLCQPHPPAASTCSDQAVIGTQALCAKHKVDAGAGGDAGALLMPSADDRDRLPE